MKDDQVELKPLRHPHGPRRPRRRRLVDLAHQRGPPRADPTVLSTRRPPLRRDQTRHAQPTDTEHTQRLTHRAFGSGDTFLTSTPRWCRCLECRCRGCGRRCWGPRSIRAAVGASDDLECRPGQRVDRPGNAHRGCSWTAGSSTRRRARSPSGRGLRRCWRSSARVDIVSGAQGLARRKPRRSPPARLFPTPAWSR